MIIDPLHDPSIEHGSCRCYVALLAIGSIEYHGGYLPLAVDTLIADRLIELFLQRHSLKEGVCIVKLPPIYYGYSIEWSRYEGTISIPYNTVIDFVKSIYDCLRKVSGFKGLVIVNGHGGNKSVLEVMARELAWSYGGSIAVIDIWSIAKELGLEYCHACLFEVELAKHLGIDVYGEGSMSKAMLSRVEGSYTYTPHSPSLGFKGTIPSINEFLEKFYSILLDTIESLAYMEK